MQERTAMADKQGGDKWGIHYMAKRWNKWDFITDVVGLSNQELSPRTVRHVDVQNWEKRSIEVECQE